jgi:hypothetical protein
MSNLTQIIKIYNTEIVFAALNRLCDLIPDLRAEHSLRVFTLRINRLLRRGNKNYRAAIFQFFTAVQIMVVRVFPACGKLVTSSLKIILRYFHCNSLFFLSIFN